MSWNTELSNGFVTQRDTINYSGRTFLCSLGKTVRKALEDFRKKPTPYPGPSSVWAAGNGSLMRLSPLTLAYAGNPSLAMEVSARHSRTTHGAKIAIDTCRYFAGM